MDVFGLWEEAGAAGNHADTARTSKLLSTQKGSGIPFLESNRQPCCEATAQEVLKILYYTHFVFCFFFFPRTPAEKPWEIIFTGNSIFSPWWTASSDTACLAPRQKQHFVGLSTFFFFFCREQKQRKLIIRTVCFLFLKLKQEKEGK